MNERQKYVLKGTLAAFLVGVVIFGIILTLSIVKCADEIYDPYTPEGTYFRIAEVGIQGDSCTNIVTKEVNDLAQANHRKYSDGSFYTRDGAFWSLGEFLVITFILCVLFSFPFILVGLIYTILQKEK